MTEITKPCPTTNWHETLTAEYRAWNKAQGLNLGSADEHYFDESLTEEQLHWVRDFCRRWEEAQQAASAAKRLKKARDC